MATLNDGINFLGFSVFFAIGLVFISFAVAICIHVVSASINGISRKDES